jgi:hypothetical protein
MFGMPRPQGWMIERAVSLMAGSMILITLDPGAYALAAVAASDRLRRSQSVARRDRGAVSIERYAALAGDSDRG